MATVDVLLPNRNYGKFLEQALESCLNQTCRDLNVVVVDDNSTDNSRDILNKYENSCKIIYLDDDKPGIAKSRNTLIEHSSSPYLCFLSSDDYYKEDFIERSLEVLKQHPSDEIGGVYSTFSWVNEIGEVEKAVSRRSYPTREALHSDCAKPSCIVTFESSLFKRCVFETDQKFDPEVIYGEETHFIAMMTRKFHFVKNPTNESFAFKRRHSHQGHTLYTSYHQQILIDKIQANIAV